MATMSSIRHKTIDVSDIRSLLDLACSGLDQMLDKERGIFCDRLVCTGDKVRREGISERYTAMTLLGLNRYHATGFETGYALNDMARALLTESEWAADIGDVGLLIWVYAELIPSELEQCLRVVDLRSVIKRSDSFRRRQTMEIAWLLTGISKAVLANPMLSGQLNDVAQSIYGRLLGNRGRSGFFGHRSSGVGPAAWRGRIGSFADQVYPIYALTSYARAFSIAESLQIAVDCAKELCKAQGPMGQWWWHYDAVSGRVIQRYPVYSVHQEAMGPMALLEVGRAARMNFDAEVLKGLAWIYGRNELQEDMRDTRLGVVWRCIKIGGNLRPLLREIGNWGKSGNEPTSADGLSVLKECRPYELGWLLFAFSEYKASAA